MIKKSQNISEILLQQFDKYLMMNKSIAIYVECYFLVC